MWTATDTDNAPARATYASLRAAEDDAVVLLVWDDLDALTS